MDPDTGDGAVVVWRTAAATYPTELALARKVGLLLSPRTKSLPSRQNAASIYRRMDAVKDGQATASAPTEALLSFLNVRLPTPDQIHRAQQATRLCSDLHLSHQAVLLSHCDFERLPNTPSPGLTALRQAARLLSAESLLLAHQGKIEQSIRNQALTFRVVRHAAAGNTLIDWLVALAVDAIALAGMARILTVRQGEAATASAIAKVLQKEWQPRALAPVIEAETAWQCQELTYAHQRGFFAYLLRNVDEMFAAFPGETAAEKAETERGRKQAHAEIERTLRPMTIRALRTDKANETLLLDATAAFMLRWMRKLRAAVDKPYRTAAPIIADFRRDLEVPSSMPDGPKAIRLIPALLMATLAAPLESKAYETARGVTLLAATRLLANRPRQTTAPFPDRISDLPLDPFSGIPLRYRKEGRGFVVFSVGPDGAFDGGRHGVPLVGQKSGLLFRHSADFPG